MARISQKDRDEAIVFIKQALNEKELKLRADNAAKLEEIEERAKAEVEKRFGLDSMMREVASLRKQADEIERQIHAIVGSRNVSYFLRDKILEKTNELLSRTHLGKQLKRLEEKSKYVRRDVFLATGHEELVALVREAVK